MASLPFRYVYSCPEPHTYDRTPLSEETSERTMGDGVIIQRYPFACYDHAQGEYERKYKNLKEKYIYVKRTWQRSKEAAEEDLRERTEAESAERVKLEKLARHFQELVDDVTEREEKAVEAFKEDLKRRWALDPK